MFFEFTQGSAEHYEKLKEKATKMQSVILPEATGISSGKDLNARLAACMLAAAANVAPLNAPSNPYTFQRYGTS